jgi:uncharacterized protein (DUF111 family)
MKLPEISIEDCAFLELSIADFHNACLMHLKKEVIKSRRQLFFTPWFMKKRREKIALEIIRKIGVYENIARISMGLLGKIEITEASETQGDNEKPVTYKEIKEMKREVKEVKTEQKS